MSDAGASILPVLPAAVTAMQDGALQGNPRELYVWFLRHLDVVRFRPVKLSEVKLALRMSEASASIATRKLADLGYVERERTRTGRVDSYAYRLVYSNPDREPRSGRGSDATAKDSHRPVASDMSYEAEADVSDGFLRMGEWCLRAQVTYRNARNLAERGKVRARITASGRWLLAAEDADRVRALNESVSGSGAA